MEEAKISESHIGLLDVTSNCVHKNEFNYLFDNHLISILEKMLVDIDEEYEYYNKNIFRKIFYRRQIRELGVRDDTICLLLNMLYSFRIEDEV